MERVFNVIIERDSEGYYVASLAAIDAILYHQRVVGIAHPSHRF